MLKDYYYLTKPGIIRANVMTAAAGYIFGAKEVFDWKTFLSVLLGTSLVIASGCVFNNILDRHIDARMRRTMKRALVTGAISLRNAAMFGTVLAVLGFTILASATNTLTVLIGAAALILYVGAYGYAKRFTSIGTEVGSLPGSASILAGYTAATGSVDSAGWILLAVLVLWQMPHFYAISIFRAKEYKKAGIDVLPLTQGVPHTKLRIRLYICLFIGATLSLWLFGGAGISYAFVTTLLGVYWLLLAFNDKGLKDEAWARKIFGVSLLVLLVFSLMISLDYWLP